MSGNINSGKMPVLFIGHGSPMNIILDNDYTQSLVRLGKELPRPEAIMVISAHWMTDGHLSPVMKSRKPSMISMGFHTNYMRSITPVPVRPIKRNLHVRLQTVFR